MKSASDVLSFEDVYQSLPPLLVKLFPTAHSHTLCFLGDDETYDHLDFQFGQSVRLKTKGDSPFVGNGITVTIHDHSSILHALLGPQPIPAESLTLYPCRVINPLSLQSY